MHIRFRSIQMEINKSQYGTIWNKLRAEMASLY